MRTPFVTSTVIRRLALANVVTNIGIVVSGGAVRLTGSGLGCSTWPKCTSDDLVPTSAMPIHTYIEFGNRLLTFVVAIVAIATFVAIRLAKPVRRDLSLLALLVGLGIPAQAVLGGITVLTGLNPYTVMAHFLVSVVLVGLATVLWRRTQLDERAPYLPARPWMRTFVVVLTATAFVTLALGTFVTGSGPHGGDPKAGRTGFDPALVSQLHADIVFLLVGLTVALVILVNVINVGQTARRAAYILLGVELAQGVIGYVQYFTGLPLALVELHMLGAALLTAAVANVVVQIAAPRGVPSDFGSTSRRDRDPFDPTRSQTSLPNP
ncbi:COX15/CtaA family protein [Antricoccus suffuscus]|uniref:COX15/CtaA family protein n=1 Tax=Antricoccus suffuscus TaxID=1629062 RepID=UPI000D07879D|nr:COX15/CtaA family protein [Antricoccus suffuscus]